MAASLASQVGSICEQMVALQTEVAGLERQTNLYAREDISRLLHSGDAVLKSIRTPVGVVKTATGEAPDGANNGVEAAQASILPKENSGDANLKGKIGEDEALRFLRGLDPEINARFAVAPVPPPSFLRSNVQPFSHQLRAAALGVHAESSVFKGMILADPPGLGKTLATEMAVDMARQQGDGPTVLVVPSSCTRQWMQEIRSNSADGATGVLLLNDHNISPFDLFRYKTIVTSYGQVVAEYRRLVKFEEAMEQYESEANIVVPKRPKLTLLSGIWEMDGVQMLGRYLGLDEAHAIKNTSSRTYAAINLLRARFNVCLMMTGTPLDNTWADVFSLLSLLRGHPFVSMLRTREIFTDAYRPGQKKRPELCVPRGKWLLRLVQMLHAVTTARPAATIGKTLPKFIKKTIEFDLPRDELQLSDKAYQAYEKTRGAKKQDQGYSGGEEGDSMVKWSALIQAQQYAFHPKLVEMMELERKVLRHNMTTQDSLDDVELTPEEEAKYKDWAENLKKGEASRSARIDCIIDIINRHRDCRPDDAFLILDESVFFLDILDTALRHVMYDPPEVFRFDGRQNPAERHITMEDFRKAAAGINTQVMLASRGTGGQGLNVQCANVVIRCGPWWKTSWELQAEIRVYRPGQTKPVYVYEVLARKCKVENYKKKVSDKKNVTNEKIMNLITLDDAQPPQQWHGA